MSPTSDHGDRIVDLIMAEGGRGLELLKSIRQVKPEPENEDRSPRHITAAYQKRHGS